jgi:hypothetical protein
MRSADRRSILRMIGLRRGDVIRQAHLKGFIINRFMNPSFTTNIEPTGSSATQSDRRACPHRRMNHKSLKRDQFYKKQ